MTEEQPGGGPVGTTCPETARGGRLSYAVLSLARAHRGMAARLLRDLGLHPGQEVLLMLLLDRDGRSQSELLDSVGLDHSTVSRSLRRMEEAGLIVRCTPDNDRRCLVVSLTDEGRALGPRLDAMWCELERISTRGLDAATVTGFIEVADRIQRSIAGCERPG